MSQIYKDALMHHGVKGMKWGVRKDENEDGLYVIGKAVEILEKSKEKRDMFVEKMKTEHEGLYTASVRLYNAYKLSRLPWGKFLKMTAGML